MIWLNTLTHPVSYQGQRILPGESGDLPKEYIDKVQSLSSNDTAAPKDGGQLDSLSLADISGLSIQEALPYLNEINDEELEQLLTLELEKTNPRAGLIDAIKKHMDVES